MANPDPYWGKQNPQGTKSATRIAWERRNLQFAGKPSPNVYGLPGAPPTTGPYASGDPATPSGVSPANSRDIVSRIDQPVPTASPSPVPSFPGGPLSGPPTDQKTMLPGLPTVIPDSPSTAPQDLPQDLPPIVKERLAGMKYNSAWSAGTKYEALSKLKLWSGQVDLRNVPYGGSMASKGGQGREEPSAYQGLRPDGQGGYEREVTGDKYMALWFNMTNQERDKLRKKMVRAGIVPEEKMFSNEMLNDYGADVWALLIERSSLLWNSSQTRVTPEDLLDMYSKSGTNPLPTTKTTTRKAFNLSDGRSANQALSQLLTDRLQRLPTKAEKAAFLSALNAYERANPTVTKTTTNTITGDETATTSGGSDSGAFAYEYAQGMNKKEYAAVQAATTYYDAFMQLLGPSVTL